MINYELFVIKDKLNFAELDVEDIDIVTNVTINDIRDISIKKDNISQNIILKGTKNNNKILGNLFNHSRYVTDSTSILKSNFSLNRKIECVLFENSIMIIKGFLKVLDVKKTNNEIAYECIITGNVFNFYAQLGDKMLSDLDFSEFEHTYNHTNIIGTWFTTLGEGYMYPFINYGDKSSSSSSDVNKIHINNFRPAIYLKEYLKKIFQQPELNGFTFEIKGNDSFKAETDSLIIPNDSELFNQTSSNETIITLSNTGSTIGIGGSVVTPNEKLVKVLNMPEINDPKNFVDGNGFTFAGTTNNVFKWNREVNSDIKITFHVEITNNNSDSIKTFVRFLERDYSTVDNLNDFTTVEEILIDSIAGNSITSKDVTMVIPQRTFEENKQFTLAFFAEASGVSFNTPNFDFDITNLILVTPSIPTNVVTYSVVVGDTVKPMPVTNIKQKDFIKSFCLLYNLYTYSSLENPKNIIFETYNDYYCATKPSQISSNAIDWTYKVDNSADLTLSSYNETSKKYSFTYKSDGDYFNSLYNSKYGEVYGQYTQRADSGISEEKKIELIFSPTPLVNYNNTNRINPEIYKLNGNNSRSPIKSNIRIMYYNGLKDCNSYQVGVMDSSYSFTQIIELFSYPQTGHIRLQSGDSNTDYISDLNFGIAKEYYFLANPTIKNIPNMFTSFYSDQINELTNLNVTLFEANVFLDHIDISDLDLKKPVLINSEDGNAYYKILKVDYSNRFEPSTVQFQKVIL